MTDTPTAWALREARKHIEAEIYWDSIGQSAQEEIIAHALVAERERAEQISADAYQVIGTLLDQCGWFDTDDGIRALDYFAAATPDKNFLPWPKDGKLLKEQD